MNYFAEVSEDVLTSTSGEVLEIISKLEALREKWSDGARIIEQTCGKDSPASKALRICIVDVFDLLSKFRR